MVPSLLLAANDAATTGEVMAETVAFPAADSAVVVISATDIAAEAVHLTHVSRSLDNGRTS